MNFYKSAALALDHLDKHQGSVKGSLVAAGIKSAGGEAKRVLALIIETLKYRPVLLELLETVPVQSVERLVFPRKTPFKQPSSQSLLLVLLHDLLFSQRGKIEASDKWPPKESVLKHQARLKAELVKLQIRSGKSRKEDLAKQSGSKGEAVRYIRFNPNSKRTIEDLHKHLRELGYAKLEEATYPVPEERYFMDPHLDDVLFAFPGNATWWSGDEWYESGAVILQDKASCFPAKVLMEGWEEGEGECIDATAAPGNKTSYVSALMSNVGKLHAFERSPNRYKTLEKMLAKAHCSNVAARRADFTESDPEGEEFADVTRILLDPSCSGSGIVNRLDYLMEDDVDESDAKTERLEKLAAFQLQMILHAFKFPNAKRIVYSTCSIHAEEDESVVLSALQSPLAKKGGWGLASRDSVLPSWERRGRPEEMGGNEDLAQGVIRCLPEDKTNGFFVSCFVRGEKGLRPGAGANGKGKSKAVDADLPVSKSDDVSVGGDRKGKRKRLSNEEDEEDAKAEVGRDGKVPEEGQEEDGGENSTVNIKKVQEKTQAQLERARRKKAQQKKKRIGRAIP